MTHKTTDKFSLYSSHLLCFNTIVGLCHWQLHHLAQGYPVSPLENVANHVRISRAKTGREDPQLARAEIQYDNILLKVYFVSFWPQKLSCVLHYFWLLFFQTFAFNQILQLLLGMNCKGNWSSMVGIYLFNKNIQDCMQGEQNQVKLIPINIVNSFMSWAHCYLKNDNHALIYNDLIAAICCHLSHVFKDHCSSSTIFSQ